MMVQVPPAVTRKPWLGLLRLTANVSFNSIKLSPLTRTVIFAVVEPAHAVRGPKYVVKKGKTPVLRHRFN